MFFYLELMDYLNSASKQKKFAMAGYPEPVKYKPKNYRKYKGDPTKIIARSGWELQLMKWLDRHYSCIEWNSEGCVVPYFSPVDEKWHRYFVDFVATFKYRDGSVKKFMIEVKPYSQTQKPVKGKKKEKTFLNEAMTYTINQAKWEAAEKYAAEHGMYFIKMTEYELGLKKR
ncbi:MAG TPA: TnsA endonuclease N-terminal domain-containing protein [Methanosarcina sp.]|nr:TnsA endonuclease N-terminal domain-containing protein [Methanosarcina sp.]